MTKDLMPNTMSNFIEKRFKRRRLAATLCLALHNLILPACNRPAAAPATQVAGQTSPASDVKAKQAPVAEPPASPAETQAFIERLRLQVETFCGDCHATPRAESFVKNDWPRETALGFNFYRQSGRSDLVVPDQDEVARYFVERAPERHAMPSSITGNAAARVPFRALPVSRSQGATSASRPPCIGHLKWTDIGLGDGPTLIYCDLGSGTVNAYWPRSSDHSIQRLATLYQPVHVEPCDLDNDGKQDLIVADLGEFMAADSDLGRVIWLRRLTGAGKDAGEFETIVLQDGLGRVADVRPGDFDADGDTDLIVAEFGWRKTGSIFLLENQGSQSTSPANFVRKEIDARHGAIHVPPIDFNGDGRLDFIALVSQEFEKIEVFVNNGKGGFDIRTIWSAPDPTYGSSGIKLVDVDTDGDTDVLYCNGDSFDHGPKPYHSVQWLENRGDFQFVHHPLSEMPGVLAVDAGDYDGDGDIDFVAAAMLPPAVNQELTKSGVESIVLFEQTTPSKFERTWIEQSQCHHGAIESGDFDGDGTLDIAVGNFFRGKEVGVPDLTIWQKRTP